MIKTSQIGIRISDEEKEALRKISEKQDITMSQLIRKMIRNFIAENQ